MPLRDSITDVELARFQRAKQITDTRKLQAMLPAWIKSHMKAVAPPKPFVFVPGQPASFPARLTRRDYCVDLRKFPPCGTETKLTEYIAEFNRINNLRG